MSNALWILGLAVVLATVSWANWRAMIAHDRLHLVLTEPHLGLILNIGGLLFCAGLAASLYRWWERFLWALLVMAFLIRIKFSIGHRKQDEE